MHLDDDDIQRLIDGELAPDAAARVQTHAAACDACATLVAESARESTDITSLVRLLEAEPPRVTADAIVRRAQAESASVHAPAHNWQRWAAGIVIALAVAGAASAFIIPGLPLRAWVATLISPGAHEETAPPAPQPESAGIAVVPGANFVIAIPSAFEGAHAAVTLTDDATLSIRAESGMATFTSAAGRAIVNLRGPATLDVRIPRSAPHVEIVLGDRRILRADAGRVAAAALPIDDRYVLPLSQ